jgi:hypothetical protein
MNKKRISVFAVLAMLFSMGVAMAQSFNLPNYYPISSDPYIQSLNNGVMQNSAYALGQFSNISVLFGDVAIIIIILAILYIIIRAFAPFFK